MMLVYQWEGSGSTFPSPPPPLLLLLLPLLLLLLPLLLMFAGGASGETIPAVEVLGVELAGLLPPPPPLPPDLGTMMMRLCPLCLLVGGVAWDCGISRRKKDEGEGVASPLLLVLRW
jgi:hypothetical protein